MEYGKKMGRLQVAILLILISSFIILGIGIEKQLQERKNLHICYWQLKMWWKAIEIYRNERPNWQEPVEPPNWVEIFSVYFGKNSMGCPNAKKGIGYSIQSHSLSQYLKNKSVMMEEIPLIYDSDDNNSLFSNNLDSFSERHLGKALVLLSNGNITSNKEKDFFTILESSKELKKP